MYTFAKILEENFGNVNRMFYLYQLRELLYIIV
jgi:hypothetical protein